MGYCAAVKTQKHHLLFFVWLSLPLGWFYIQQLYCDGQRLNTLRLPWKPTDSSTQVSVSVNVVYRECHLPQLNARLNNKRFMDDNVTVVLNHIFITLNKTEKKTLTLQKLMCCDFQMTRLYFHIIFVFQNCIRDKCLMGVPLIFCPI